MKKKERDDTKLKFEAVAVMRHGCQDKKVHTRRTQMCRASGGP